MRNEYKIWLERGWDKTIWSLVCRWENNKKNLPIYESNTLHLTVSAYSTTVQIPMIIIPTKPWFVQILFQLRVSIILIMLRFIALLFSLSLSIA
jgi:hypothetical protein